MNTYYMDIRFTVNARHFIGKMPHMNSDIYEVIKRETQDMGSIAVLSYNIESPRIERKISNADGYRISAFVDMCCRYGKEISALNRTVALNRAVDDIYKTINKYFRGHRGETDALMYSSAVLVEEIPDGDRMRLQQQNILQPLRNRIDKLIAQSKRK